MCSYTVCSATLKNLVKIFKATEFYFVFCFLNFGVIFSLKNCEKSYLRFVVDIPNKDKIFV